MLLVYFVIAAIPLGYLLKGRLRNYLHAPLRMEFLPVLAFALEACFGRIGPMTGLEAAQWLPWAVCAEYALLTAFILLNIRRRGVKLLAVATAMNFAVISANGFRMPVSPRVFDYPALAPLIERIQSGDIPEYVLADWDAPLLFLGDVLPIAGGLASVGDLFMAAGMLVLIVHLMRSPAPENPQ